MNRLMTEAVLTRATQGQRLLIVDRTLAALQAHFDDTVAQLDSDTTQRIIRTTGKLRIELTSGGNIRFLTYRNTRGATADVIVAYNERDLTEPEHTAFAPATVTAREIMRADD